MTAFKKSFAALRFLAGALFLTAPSLGCRLFLIPFAPQASLAVRLFGVREVVLGSLLWRAKDPEESRRLYVQTIAVDSVDLVATAVCYIEGRLDLIPTLTTVGGGILVFLAMGLVGFKQESEYEQTKSDNEQ